MRRSPRYDTVDPANDLAICIHWSTVLYILQFLSTLIDMYLGKDGVTITTEEFCEYFHHFIWWIGYFVAIYVLYWEFVLCRLVHYASRDEEDDDVQESIFSLTKHNFVASFVKDSIVSFAKYLLANHNEEVKSQLQSESQLWACKVTFVVSVVHLVLLFLQACARGDRCFSRDSWETNKACVLYGCTAVGCSVFTYWQLA